MKNLQQKIYKGQPSIRDRIIRSKERKNNTLVFIYTDMWKECCEKVMRDYGTRMLCTHILPCTLMSESPLTLGDRTRKSHTHTNPKTLNLSEYTWMDSPSVLDRMLTRFFKNDMEHPALSPLLKNEDHADMSFMYCVMQKDYQRFNKIYWSTRKTNHFLQKGYKMVCSVAEFRNVD